MLASPVLKKPDTDESKRIRLESPILHIGLSVSRLKPFEYVQTTNKVYRLNQEAIAKAFKKQGGRFLDDYIQAINDRQDITNLLKQAFGDEWWNIVDTDGAEMVRNVHTEFTLTLDTEMLTWFKHKQAMQLPFSTLDELIKICQEFAQYQWDYEHDYWNDIQNNPRASGRNLDFNYIREFYEPEKSPYALRLGWGSKMTKTTVDLLFDSEFFTYSTESVYFSFSTKSTIGKNAQ
jgi:hypothetical protein